MSIDQQEQASEPWDYIEPALSAGDPDYNDTLRGSGLVLHEWTLVEIALSHLQAILSGNPRDGAAIQAYGTGRVFTSRLVSFRQVADTYFVRNCHQHREAELHELMRQAEHFATRRNEVAHGAIRNILTLDPKSGSRTPNLAFFLVCPYYDQRGKSLFDHPFYRYNAATLEQLATNIAGLQVALETFADALMPDNDALVDRRPWLHRLQDE
jgi:hypothetical protein